MTHPRFFGYGSLVNCATHIYPNPVPATLSGWRRAWVKTAAHPTVLLTAVPDAGSQIDGLTAAVPDGDWVALDARESGYQRHVTTALTPLPETETSVYAVAPKEQTDTGDHTILLSYLDVVVQGFLQVFGEDGVARFFDTTDGWDTPILNDRAAPRYPRHQVLSADETALVHAHIDRLGARII